MLVPLLSVAVAAPAAAAGPVSGAIGLGRRVVGVDRRTDGVVLGIGPVGDGGGAGIGGRVVVAGVGPGAGGEWAGPVGVRCRMVAGGVVHRPGDSGDRSTRPTAARTGWVGPTRRVWRTTRCRTWSTPGPRATYPFTLTYDDGRVDGFDEHGNLANRVDRFGNRTQLTWEAVARRWMASVDHRGRVRVDDEVHLRAGLGDRVGTGPLGRRGRGHDDHVGRPAARALGDRPDRCDGARSSTHPLPGTNTEFLTSVVSATQARTTVTYADVSGQPGLTVVQSLITVDAAGNVVGPARLFSLNPPENTERPQLHRLPDLQRRRHRPAVHLGQRLPVHDRDQQLRGGPPAGPADRARPLR